MIACACVLVVSHALEKDSLTAPHIPDYFQP